MALFGAQPEGTGPFSRRTALHFTHVQQVHIAQCVLSREKMATGAGVSLVLTGPRSMNNMTMTGLT